MRTRPLLYVCLMVLAVFFLPADTFANNGNTLEQASPQADEETSNPVAVEAAEKGGETSQAAKKQAAEKVSQASDTAETASSHGKETTGNINKQDKKDKHAEDAADKPLPPQANEKASETGDKVKQEAAQKKETVKKAVTDNPHENKGRSNRPVEKSSAKNEEPATKTNTPKSSKDKQADGKKDLQPVEAEAEPTKVKVEPSAADQGDSKAPVPADDQERNKQGQEQSAPQPEPRKKPIAQIHMTKPASFPSPVSSGGGDLGGKTAFSFIKGNLPDSFLLVAAHSQTIGMRSDFLTDQWVNAPPAEPPKTAS
ncbi:hypothetical protein GCM10007216_28400 [Thalassobacillus devorans]|uniref:Uncharacterized protein n=1 Tax=Thalassobacillus devorans TaxID=279813 RepID=A0ABQ1PF72_9BACI|nr:hypothetical protein [Thalassobacillus devorans]NIK29345.1 hypothetical protein [Thalassobacillus devorans]GGC95945.1 hypothetical protein GCM10007216_28400 [Thalassobacillus devorans]